VTQGACGASADGDADSKVVEDTLAPAGASVEVASDDGAARGGKPGGAFEPREVTRLRPSPRFLPLEADVVLVLPRRNRCRLSLQRDELGADRGQLVRGTALEHRELSAQRLDPHRGLVRLLTIRPRRADGKLCVDNRYEIVDRRWLHRRRR